MPLAGFQVNAVIESEAYLKVPGPFTTWPASLLEVPWDSMMLLFLNNPGDAEGAVQQKVLGLPPAPPDPASSEATAGAVGYSTPRPALQQGN